MCVNKQLSSIRGSLDGLAGQGVSGWVCRPERPDERLWVELLVDDCVLSCARAESYHQDATAYGDGCYGFWLALPPLAQGCGLARVRVANTAEEFSPPLQLEKAAESEPLLQGELCSDLGLSLSGWMLDPSEPRDILTVSAWLDGKCLTEKRADERRFRPEHADGHGFTLSLPPELADGREYLVTVQDEYQRPLPGSPILVCTVLQGLTDWFDSQKNKDQRRPLFSSILRRLERHAPRSLSFMDYTAWKQTFPVPPVVALSGKQTVGVCVSGVCSDAALKALHNQHGVSCTVYNQSPAEQLAAASAHEYILYMDGSDILHPRALAYMTRALHDSGAGLMYADSEVPASENPGADHALQPCCKPAWDRFLYLGQEYLGPILFSRKLALCVTTQPEDSAVALRARLVLAAEKYGIRHLPQILSQTAPSEQADQNEQTRRTELRRWLTSRNPGALLEAHPFNAQFSRVRWPLPADAPLVSLIIPTRDHADMLQRCLDSLRMTRYPRLEILLVDNGSVQPEALKLLKQVDKSSQNKRENYVVRVLSWPGIFNYAAINNFAAQEARGSLLCLLNNDTEILTADWLEEMVALLLSDRDIGCVGAKLLWPNGMVQHGGVIVGIHELACHVGNGWLDAEAGALYSNQLTRQWSAVTAACMLTSKDVFLGCGGFDAVRFPVAFNDVDYCLRLRAQGKKILWTPHARILHHESASRGRDVSPMNKSRADKEMHSFRTRWGYYDDPFYNPNLTLSAVLEPFGGLALPPRNRSIR